MISIKPIEEQDVLDLFAKKRFSGALQGYVISDGASLLGHALYRIDGDTAVLLEAEAEDNGLVDGVIRACVARGETMGAKFFTCEANRGALHEWFALRFSGQEKRISIAKLLGGCCG